MRFLFRALVASVLFPAGSLVAQVSFYGVGSLAGGVPQSEMRDAIMTPTGILAVGNASLFNTTVGDTAVQWTPAGGLVPLANPFPGNLSQAFITGRAISQDGRVIGGSTHGAAAGNLRSACLWTNGGATVTSLPFLGGGGTPNVGISCLSADGTIAYGFNRSADGVQPFYYTAGGGMIALGFLNPGDDYSTPVAHAVSADGTIMAGNSTVDANPGLGAFRYVHTGSGPTGGVMTALPGLPGATWNGVCAMTSDGAVTVGASDSPDYPNGQLVRWDTAGAITASGSPDPAFGIFSGFGGVADGGATVALGLYDRDGNGLVYVHNPSGWFELSSILTAAGIDVSDWTLNALLGMSSDGLLIYGRGIHVDHNEGWVAQFPAGYLKSYGDVTPPVITSLAVTPSVLHPPNHKMVNVVVSINATDAVGPITYHIVSITSNEPDNGSGDGNTTGDAVITGPLTAQVRSERAGNGNGRIYTLKVAATDAAGNTATGHVTVSVPK